MKGLSKKISKQYDEELFNILVKILREDIELGEINITRDSEFREGLKMDDLKIYELYYACHEKLDVPMPKKLYQFKEVGEYMDYIAEEELFNRR
jgi:acyl carrier protein